MDECTLAIADYLKSSWSMRAWLLLKAAGVKFKTVQLRLYQPDTRAQILKFSPSGKVPALILKDHVVYDSLAIAETIAERFPRKKLWPEDQTLRARTRSAAAEMHSGFVNLRTHMPFGVNIEPKPERILPEVQQDIDRIFNIWRELRTASRSSGFLCGGFGVVDAMYAPVVFRFRRFGVELPDALKPYAQAMLSYPPVSEWLMLAQEELQRAG